MLSKLATPSALPLSGLSSSASRLERPCAFSAKVNGWAASTRTRTPKALPTVVANSGSLPSASASSFRGQRRPGTVDEVIDCL